MSNNEATFNKDISLIFSNIIIILTNYLLVSFKFYYIDKLTYPDLETSFFHL